MKNIRKILRKTRQWAINNRPKNITLDLECQCAIASAKLYKQLKQAKYNPYLKVSNYHCWIELDDLALDITATQFGLTPITIMNKENYIKILDDEGYKGDYIKTFYDYKSFKKHIKEWPKEQQPKF